MDGFGGVPPPCDGTTFALCAIGGLLVVGVVVGVVVVGVVVVAGVVVVGVVVITFALCIDKCFCLLTNSE